MEKLLFSQLSSKSHEAEYVIKMRKNKGIGESQSRNKAYPSEGSIVAINHGHAFNENDHRSDLTRTLCGL